MRDVIHRRMRIVHYKSHILAICVFAALTVACTADVSSETQAVPNEPVVTEPVTEDGKLRTVPFLTVRNKTGTDKAAEYFGGERSSLQAGICELLRTQYDSLKTIKENVPFYIPDEIVKLDAVVELSVEDFWRRFERTSNSQAPVMYMHGFYISFDRGCRRAVLLKESLDLSGRFVHFSWPSDGSILNYTQDEADLYWSVGPLRELLADMIQRFGVGNANVIAHSLGTRGVMLALVLMAQGQQDNEPLLNHVVLIAPDIDVGIFKQYVPMIRPLARTMTVYVSSNDSPLALSRQVHGHPRLGEAGEHLEGLTDIEIIDLSDMPITVPSGHLYHLYDNQVINDLSQLINENKPAAQRRDLKKISQNYWRLQQIDSDK